MWTERIKYLNNLEEIDAYLKYENCFHDYLIGDFSFDGNSASINIEEPTKNTFKNGETRKIWDLEINQIIDIKIENDCIFRFMIKDTYIDNEYFILELDQGYIKFKAKEIKLGIPKEL